MWVFRKVIWLDVGHIDQAKSKQNKKDTQSTSKKSTKNK